MALIISLIMLVSLTMLGITAIQRTTADLSMAGNQREIGLMFQAAEMGLAQAESFIEATGTNAAFNNANSGLFTVPTDNSAYYIQYFDKDTWQDKSSSSPTSLQTKLGLIEEPRYMVEYLGDRSQNPLANINIGGYGTQPTGDIVSIYRATARGVGVTGRSFRYLQSFYGKDAS